MNEASVCSVSDLADRHRNIFNQLDKLGYKYPHSQGSLPLLEELIKDLLISKNETEQYKRLVKNVQQEKINLEKGLVPYQQDNGRLVLENNELQGQLFRVKQEHEKERQEFRRKTRERELQAADLEFMHKVTLERVKELEKNNKLLSLALKSSDATNTGGKSKLISTQLHIPDVLKLLPVNEKNRETTGKLTEKKCGKSRTAGDTDKNMPDNMDRQSAELLEELEELKLDNHHQADIIAALKCQITQKDREICRLKHAVEGGRPLTAVQRDCCYQCKQKDRKIESLEEQLEEAVEKQHEAMNRALHLADRNQHLERELKDIDNMALAVEKECQSKVKSNLKNLDVMEEKLRQKNDEIKKLEDTVLSMKNKMERNDLDVENLRRDKQFLEKSLQTVTGEKKQLNDKINYFLLIEKNLNSEISRMQEINKSLQRQITDMETRVMDILGTNCKSQSKGKPKKYNYTLGLPNSKTDESKHPVKLCKGDRKYCDDDHNDCFHKSMSITFLDKIQQERDFYHNECHRLKDQLGNLPCRTDSNTELVKHIKDLDKEIMDLKQENLALRRENSALAKKMEYSEHLSCSSGDSIKIILDRLEKERDMALSDISRLQGERDALRERIKLANECQIGEQSRLEKIVRENEERIRRLETERRDLITCQSSQRIALANMEEQCDEYKESIRKAQNELAQAKANYSQLKALHEQTDRSYSDAQTRQTQAEVELRVAATKVADLERINANLESEIAALKKEKTTLMTSVTFVEKEKDGLLITLDEKTEKVAKLEHQIKKQEDQITDLTGKITHLEKKFEYTLSEKTNQEYGFRNLEREVERLRDELQQNELQKESLIRENRRLQDDLASAAKDCLTARRELDMGKQDVDNLKKQLQQYVTEVKRAEELLTKKESERNQMLEHFRSLSMEATTLETNNHTLESTVENTKTQLIAANNKIMDLEHAIASKDTLLYNYEKQISELSTQIAELETKLKQQTEMRIRAEEDLTALRDLCSTLDGQKEAFRRQASSNDAEKVHLINEVRRLSEEYEGLNQKLTHERSLSQTLEKSLTNSRQETLEHKITNKDLQTHVQQLRQKVDDLTQKLEAESQDVRRYQAQCADLSQQVSELRREVTNARFEQAKTVEDTRRFSCILKPETEEEYPCSLASSFRSLPASTRTYTWSADRRKIVSDEYVTGSAGARVATSEDVRVSPEVACDRFDDDANEMFFDEVPPDGDDSSRNIPLLNFPEDSDRTVSLDSDADNLKYLLDESATGFRKPYWRLSPLVEKCEVRSKCSTESELSSLPEDGKSKVPSPEEEEDKTDSSVYPTYSVRGGPSDEAEHLDCEPVGSYRSSDSRCPNDGGIRHEARFDVGCRSRRDDDGGGDFHVRFQTECRIWEDSRSGCHMRVTGSSTSSPSPPDERGDESVPSRSCGVGMMYPGEGGMVEVDENTFSLCDS